MESHAVRFVRVCVSMPVCMKVSPLRTWVCDGRHVFARASAFLPYRPSSTSIRPCACIATATGVPLDSAFCDNRAGVCQSSTCSRIVLTQRSQSASLDARNCNWNGGQTISKTCSHQWSVEVHAIIRTSLTSRSGRIVRASPFSAVGRDLCVCQQPAAHGRAQAARGVDVCWLGRRAPFPTESVPRLQLSATNRLPHRFPKRVVRACRFCNHPERGTSEMDMAGFR